MEGDSVISPEVVARYAADAACEVDGVTRIVAGRAARDPRRGRGDRAPPGARASASRSRSVGAAVQANVADYLERMTDARPARSTSSSTRSMSSPRLTGLTRLTLETAPSVCHDCVWWQSRRPRARSTRTAGWSASRTSFGAFGTVYYDDDGRLLGVLQCGPAPLFPHAVRASGGPALRRGDARHLRLRHRPVEPVGAAVALPGGDRRGARPRRRVDRGVRLPLPGGRVGRTSASCTRPSSRSTSSATSASGSSAAPGGSGSRGSTSAGCSRSSRAGASGCCAS